MLNVSIEGEKLILDRGYYVVIDGLYLNDIRDYILSKAQESGWEFSDLKSKVFPYTDTPFALIEIAENAEFDLRRFHKVEFDSITDSEDNYLSTDTGLLLFIKKGILVEFVEEYDFDKLVDLDPIDTDYWSSIIKDFNDSDIGLIVSPGINSEFEFDGGGLYQII